MGVYIDVEMPKNCFDCTMESICSRWALHDAEWQKENRDKDCPLAPVPPHGRLIDADAFGSIKYELPNGQKAFNRGFHSGVQYVQRLIMDAPTIIPAEEGET